MSSFHEPVLISFETYFLSRSLFSADQCRCCFHDEIASKFTAVGKNNKSKMKSLLVSIITEANTSEVTRGHTRRTNTQGLEIIKYSNVYRAPKHHSQKRKASSLNS